MKQSGVMQNGDVKKLLKRWNILSSNMKVVPLNASVILPDLFVVSQSDHMVSELVEGISDYLEESFLYNSNIGTRKK